MEKYFVTEITKTSDSEAYAKLITEKDSLTDAKMLYHQTLASIYANVNIEYAMIYVTDYYGNILMTESIIPAPVA